MSITPETFAAALRFITTYYSPVCLQDVLTNCNGRGLPPRAVLVTFDDAYASVAEHAAPLCQQFGVPATFFANAAFVDNQRLAPDNLVCYVANVMGMETINAGVRAIPGWQTAEIQSLSEVFKRFFPAISLAEREVFLDVLRYLADINETRLAREARLYLTSKQLCELAAIDFEIGNHTYTHSHCRSFSRQDFISEVDRNREELEAMTGTKVRSFSQPYGSSTDITHELVEHLKRSGYQAVFLSEGVANSRRPDAFHIDRVTSLAKRDDARFLEIEVLPRLRAIRNWVFRNSSPARTRRFHSLAGRAEISSGRQNHA